MLKIKENVEKICKNVEKISNNVEKCLISKILPKRLKCLKVLV